MTAAFTSAGPRTTRTQRLTGGCLRAGSAIAPVDLCGAQVPEPVPADVVARQLEENLGAREALLDGALDRVEHGLARVRRVEQERAPEDRRRAVPDDARLEDVSHGEPDRLA